MRARERAHTDGKRWWSGALGLAASFFPGGDEGGLAEDGSEGGTNWGLTCAIALAVLVGLLVCGGLATFAVGGLFRVAVRSSSGSGPAPQRLFLQEYVLPHAHSTPLGIAVGPDGAVWFTESDGRRIGRITAQGTISEFGLQAGSGKPLYLATGADGNLWFTEDNGHIGRMTPKGTATEFALATPHVVLGGIAAGGDGDMWFTEFGAKDAIGRITPQGASTEYALPQPGSQAAAITAGADGSLWFTEITGNRVGRITLQGTITEFAIPTAASDPERITAGPDGAVWVTENAVNKLARVASDGHITEHALGSGGPLSQARDLSGIAAQQGSWLWVSTKDNTLVRLSTDGSVSAVMGLPTANSQPGDLAVTGDGTIWCVEPGANAIARVQIASVTAG